MSEERGGVSWPARAGLALVALMALAWIGAIVWDIGWGPKW